MLSAEQHDNISTGNEVQDIIVQCYMYLLSFNWKRAKALGIDIKSCSQEE